MCPFFVTDMEYWNLANYGNLISVKFLPVWKMIFQSQNENSHESLHSICFFGKWGMLYSWRAHKLFIKLKINKKGSTSPYDIYMVQYAIIQFYRWKSWNIDVFSFALNRKLLQATSSNITHFLQNKKCPDMMLNKNEDFHFLRDFFTNIWEIYFKNLIFNIFLFSLSFNI